MFVTVEREKPQSELSSFQEQLSGYCQSNTLTATPILLGRASSPLSWILIDIHYNCVRYSGQWMTSWKLGRIVGLESLC